MASINRTVPVKNAQRLVDLSKRFADPDSLPDAAPTPASTNDLITELYMTRNIFLDTGNEHTIDVQPDYRIIFRALTYHVIRIFPEFDIRPHPVITPMSIMAYLLFCLYGFALTCDSHARRLKSHYCNKFHQNPNAREFLQSLLSMHIPAFMTDFIIALSPTADPRRPGLEFINTLGAAHMRHDLYRLPTPAMFLAAHDLLASTRSNIDPHTLYNQWYDTIFYTNTSTTPPHVFKIANFFGTNYDHNNASHTHSNWLNNAVETLFNPVVSRALSARPTYRKTPISFLSTNSWDFDPYSYLLCTDDNNVFNTIGFIDEVSRFFDSSKLTTFQLGQVFSKTTGISILTHYVTEPSLPTWHNLSINSKGDTVPTSDTDTTFATRVTFLGAPAFTPHASLKYPTDDSTIDKFLYLVHKGKFDPEKEPENWITFDPHTHVHPTVRYFDPYDYSPSKLGYTVISGLTIESFELDGFTLPQVNLRSSLNDENDQFLQSAISAANLWYPTDPTFRTLVARRSVTRAHSQKVSLSLFNFAKTRLPVFSEAVTETALPTSLPGFHVTTHVRSLSRGSTKLSFRSHDNTLLPKPLFGWSSYRYVRKQKPSISHDILFLMSFRTIYGTNVTLSESRHPSFLLPN